MEVNGGLGSNVGCVSLQWVWPAAQDEEEAGGDIAELAGWVAGSGSAPQARGELGRGLTGSQHICQFCGYVAQRRQHLEAHVRTHTGERPHQCPQCSYRCSDFSNLKKHVRIHSGEKPFACSHCNFRTGDSGSLKKHMKHHLPPVQATNQCNS